LSNFANRQTNKQIQP